MKDLCQILVGDCREKLLLLPDNSVDAGISDPPYELGFMGKTWDSTGIAYDVSMWREVLRVLKPGAHLLAFGGSRTYHRLACAIEDAGFDIRDQIMWIYGSGFPKSRNLDGDLEGWGTALKPAHEPIVMARKPLEGTVAANVLQHGTGALNIDASRIPGGSGGERTGEDSADRRYTESGATNFSATPGPRGGDVKGRWPANIIHDGSDEVIDSFPAAPGQMRAVGPQHGKKASVNCYGDYGARDQFEPRGDTGSAARFFYCAKASRDDRDDGCDDLPTASPGEITGGRRELSAGLSNPRAGAGAGAGRTSGGKNIHPTVKPTALMRYLCRLVTPPGGVILDPFMGSGSTGRAALLEQFQFIGIELSPEYADIARRRIRSTVPPLFAEA